MTFLRKKTFAFSALRLIAILRFAFCPLLPDFTAFHLPVTILSLKSRELSFRPQLLDSFTIKSSLLADSYLKLCAAAAAEDQGTCG